ncbi:hypothetical protein [Klebsiella quasipneumoniae]|uniref:hypothetical protein n=1 Tax=Klebsiella quasipneumoniae TaxID=1463165 RepID=UPI00388F95F2
MAHDVPLGCAPDEYDDLISGTCSHLPLEHLHQQGIIQPHPAGEVALSAAEFEVENPYATARRWSALFDLPMTTRAGNPALRIGDKYFQFNQGNSNALVQLDFLTDTAALKGQTILVGEGRYAFH